LKDGEGDRRVFQDKMNNLEGELETATCENLKLKSLTFDLDFKINHHSILLE